MHYFYSIPWTKLLQQWLPRTINKHKDIMRHAVRSNNCSGDCVLTTLWRQTFSFAFLLALLFSNKFECVCYTARLTVFVYKCKQNRVSRGALTHICLTVQNYGSQAGSVLSGRGERERGPPASCPGFVYNKKPLFDVVAQTAPKLPLPQDVLWVKCQTEATAG